MDYLAGNVQLVIAIFDTFSFFKLLTLNYMNHMFHTSLSLEIMKATQTFIYKTYL